MGFVDFMVRSYKSNRSLLSSKSLYDTLNEYGNIRESQKQIWKYKEATPEQLQFLKVKMIKEQDEEKSKNMKVLAISMMLAGLVVFCILYFLAVFF